MRQETRDKRQEDKRNEGKILALVFSCGSIRMKFDGLKGGDERRARTHDKGNQKLQTKYVRGGDGFFGTSTLEF